MNIESSLLSLESDLIRIIFCDCLLNDSVLIDGICPDNCIC